MTWNENSSLHQGIAVVTEEQALLWADGRYHIQASKQLDASVWTLMPQGNPVDMSWSMGSAQRITCWCWVPDGQAELSVYLTLGNEGILSPEEWLAVNIAEGALIGFDPQQTSHAWFGKYSKVSFLLRSCWCVSVCSFMKALENGCGSKLQAVADNLVDKVWGSSRPPTPNSELLILGKEFCG